jgi:integrase
VRVPSNPVAQLGMPLPVSVLGELAFKRLVKAAGVRPIPFHGLRHTCASLLLNAGEPIKVVQERLAHTKIAVRMDTYAHVAPGMQKAAAGRLSALLHG